MPATKTANDHASAQAVNAAWLRWAASQPKPVLLGSIASGSSGGSNSPVVWSRDLPTTPSWMEEIELYVSLPYTLSIPAGATVYVSPFFPYCAIQNKLTIAGSPPWDQISLVPFWLDEITRRRNFDPSYSGPTLAANGGAAQQDTGTWTFNIGNASIVPGTSIHNAGGSPEVLTGTLTFTGRIRLQRSLLMTVGMIPNGDPEDRPDLELQLSTLVGPKPEDNAIQDPSASGATMSLTSAGTVMAVFRSKSLDQLPKNVSGIPSPTVGLGWSINSYDKSIQNAGQIDAIKHRSAMLFQKIFHIAVNNQQVMDFDYFGLWLTGDQQNARWQYDAANNNMQAYWKMIQDTYGRFLPTGVFLADFVSGTIPEFPQASPYQALMSPDEGYATMFGIPFTPAMVTAIRYPSGTTMTNAYVHTYSMGLVEVPY